MGCGWLPRPFTDCSSSLSLEEAAMGTAAAFAFWVLPLVEKALGGVFSPTVRVT